MTSYIIADYNSQPRLQEIISNKIISPVAGSNPVDLGYVPLPNIRGQVRFVVTSGDNSFTFMFDVVGGFGDWPGQWTQNWTVVTQSILNCTIIQLQLNRFQITTPLADAGGRVYILQFNPLQSFPPMITQTSVNIIGNNSLTVRLTKVRNVQGW
jgi:hypothetical protein